MNDKELEVGSHYLETATREFKRIKGAAEKGIAQILDDRQLHTILDKESNSIAVLIRHLSGNMVSRFTDFLTTDGEKANRNRDREFDPTEGMSRSELMKTWNRGWDCLFQTLNSLSAEDLTKRVTIRGEEHTVMEAIERHLVHCASHVGQIVYLSKHFSSEHWQALTIPRGESQKYFRNHRYLTGKKDQD
jgi:hypothetical protein